MRVLACAVGFGLGPSGKLCSVVENNKRYEWYACGDELDLSVYDSNPYLDVCWSRDEKELYSFVKKYDIHCAVNVLDPELATFLENAGLKVLYIDSLSFMWTRADYIPDNVYAYCGQKYPDFKLNPALDSVENYIWVDPIIPEFKKQDQEDYIVLNFGGLHSPFGDGVEYFNMIMDSLVGVIGHKKVYITGGRNVVELAHKNYPQFFCKTHSHLEFLKLVSGASLFFTSPGLTTIYETYGMNIKTIILPPQNLSQFYNASVARDICKEVKVLDWRCDSLNMKALEQFKDEPEEKTVQYIYEQIRLLFNNDKYRKEYELYVHSFMNEPYKNNNFTTFGANGLQQVSTILHKIVEEV